MGRDGGGGRDATWREAVRHDGEQVAEDEHRGQAILLGDLVEVPVQDIVVPEDELKGVLLELLELRLHVLELRRRELGHVARAIVLLLAHRGASVIRFCGPELGRPLSGSSRASRADPLRTRVRW